ncbi:PREDICTED: epoxide hydrolase 4-like [Branchiostoma belcheri]|uniref:Epoxide hydrolase 4-like n=1 Tax=Branchiostoma belcheri TaxID=7741 RepID=A0A6P4Z462_BRABE|nr:PREDICTED: epoxide hydrolase 4-like [Branchiostoma belcheri]
MGFFTNIVRVVATWAIASFYGCMMLLFTLLRVARRGPRAFFGYKSRPDRPKCLDDPDLGTHGYVRLKTSGLRFHYVAAGEPQKPLMLCLHGFPECWYSWRHQLKEFRNSYRVVAPDLRGYGETESPQPSGYWGWPNFSLSHLTNDVRELIEALGYSSCTLVAHDWGGFIAWQFAIDHPDLVDKLIVMNIPHPGVFYKYIATHFSQFRKSWYIFLYQLPWLPEMLIKAFDFEMIRGVFRSKNMGCRRRDAITDEDVEAFKYTFARPGANISAAINYYRALVKQPRSYKGTKVQCPTLLIWGDQDGALEVGLTEGTDRFVPDFTLKLVPGASHWVQQDQPEVVNGHMRDWLKG